MVYENQLLVDELLDADNKDKVIDLKEILPIGAIEKKGCELSVSLSLDGREYEQVHGNHANGDTARYIRIERTSSETGSVKVYAGAGYVASRNRYWTDSLKRYEGWTGADGIYSFNLTNGRDYYDNMTDIRTLFFFGDTLVSKVDRETLQREKPVYMPNNTFALLDGEDPQKPGALQFYYDTNDKGEPVGVIKPSRDCYDFEGKGEDFSKAYFWLQDGVVLGNKLYCMPSIITEDKTGPEGFQFRCLGVTIAEVDIADGMPDFKNAVQHKAELWKQTDNVTIIYGACMLPYLKEAGYKDGDGYVYVYGHMTYRTGRRSLCVARVLPDEFADWTKWRFFDGEGFVEDILKSKPLLDHVSCEMSVIPVAAGRNQGKYLAVFQYDTNSNYVAYAFGENIWGPFSKPQKVFYCDEDQIHESVYMYNAKAHLHLSYKDKILASYNVNATSSSQTDKNGHLYLPRFIQLEDTTVTFFDRLFSDAFSIRTNMFKVLNKTVVPGGAVFVGDSITNEYPLEEMFKDHMPAYNRGIGGDTTKGLLTRMNESIFDLSPSKLFLLLGTNDLAMGDPDGRQVIGNLSIIIDKVREKLPACKIHLISLLPVNNTDHPKINHEAVSPRNNQTIKKVNQWMEELAEDKKAVYVDLFSRMVDDNGSLAIAYTREGLHLTPQGYEVVTMHLKKYL